VTTAQPLSAEQVRQYREDGYVVLGKVLTDDDIAELLVEEERLRPDRGYGAETNRTLVVSMQHCHRSAPVRRVCLSGGQVPAVVQLLGPDVCLTHNQFLTKLPDAPDTHSDIPMHQDNGYGRLEPPDDITVWVALTDVTLANGCLRVVPGSHRLGLVDHDTAGVNPALREVAAAGEPVAIELAAGEALAFTGLTLHGSGPNLTDAPRTAFYVRYCSPYVRMMSEGGRPVLDDGHSWMVAGQAVPSDAGAAPAFGEPQLP
jgi:ectoine hydroxylase-related dioxygenase (phytanoyl-CoA dioxygenase family)